MSSDEPVSPPQQLQSNASTQFTSKPTLSVPSLASNASVRSEDVELASLIREVQGLRHLPKERYSLGALRVASEYRRRFGKKDSPPSTPRPVDIISAKLNVSTKEQEPVSPGQARNGDEHIHPKKRWMFQGSHVDEMTKETVTEVTCENVTVKILEKISWLLSECPLHSYLLVFMRTNLPDVDYYRCYGLPLNIWRIMIVMIWLWWYDLPFKTCCAVDHKLQLPLEYYITRLKEGNCCIEENNATLNW